MSTITTPERLCGAAGPDWANARMNGIGGSEAAAACGLDEYATPLHVYHRKRGEMSERDETDAMRLGTLLEPVVLAEFEHRTDLMVRPHPGLFRSREHGFMLATPDGEVLAETPEEQHTEGVEAKTSTWRVKGQLGDDESDELPTGWLMQCQHYIAVMGYRRVHVAVLLDGRTFRTFGVERNDRLIGHLVAAERELWERIENGDPPPPNWEHPRTPELITDIFDAVNDRAVWLSAEAAQWWGQYEELGRAIRESEKERKQLKARVLAEIGEAGIAYLPGAERCIRRKAVQRKGYTVEPKDYIDVRAAKVK